MYTWQAFPGILRWGQWDPRWLKGRGLETLVRRKNSISPKMVVVVCLVVPIALLHFFTGSAYRGPWPEFVNGYLLDILVPFAFYFLLILPEMPLLRFWPVKALLVFGAGASVEIAQYFGAPILGRIFDPLDFVMYGLGVALAAFVDTVVFPRVFGFWTSKTSTSA
jgi:hypothetical protein